MVGRRRLGETTISWNDDVPVVELVTSSLWVIKRLRRAGVAPQRLDGETAVYRFARSRKGRRYLLEAMDWP